MLRMTLVRVLAIAMICAFCGSGLLAPAGWAATTTHAQPAIKAAPMAHANPVETLLSWLRQLLSKAPGAHPPIHPDTGGCIDPMGQPCQT